MIFSKKFGRFVQAAPRGLLTVVVGVALVAATTDGVVAQEDEDDERGWVRQFDTVDVEEVEPDDLPSTVRPGADTILRTESDELPEPATQDDLREIVKHIDERLVQVVSVQTPPRPYRQMPMVHYGHALWISAPGADEPVLVSPLNWLEEADEVFIMPDDVAKDAEAEQNWKNRRRTLASVTAGNQGKRWLDEHRKKLIAVEPRNADEHRNLVTLAVDSEEVSTPSRGLELFDAENKAIFRLYGYTPFLGESLTETQVLPAHPDEEALAFYWQTRYPAILGAPLVSQEGKLVAINTFRHPKDEDVFLAIPTGAIASYVTPEDADDDKGE